MTLQYFTPLKACIMDTLPNKDIQSKGCLGSRHLPTPPRQSFQGIPREVSHGGDMGHSGCVTSACASAPCGSASSLVNGMLCGDILGQGTKTVNSGAQVTISHHHLLEDQMPHCGLQQHLPLISRLGLRPSADHGAGRQKKS